MAEDLFGTQTNITDPTERKILADVMQQFNISKQIADRQKDRYGLTGLADNANTFEIERARQLTDLLNRSRMSQAERDRLAAQEEARRQAQLAAQQAAYAAAANRGSGLTQEQLQKYIDALNASGQKPPAGKTWAQTLMALAQTAPGLVTALFGGAEGQLYNQQGAFGYFGNKLSGLFGLNQGAGTLDNNGVMRSISGTVGVDDPFNLQGLLGEGNKLPKLFDVPPQRQFVDDPWTSDGPMSYEKFIQSSPEDWGWDGTPMGWEPPDPDPLPPLYRFDE